MAIPQWQPVNFTPTKFNPSLGFAAAAKSFKGINESINADKKQESLAAYRADQNAQADRRQTFVEGAGDRARVEEKRKLALEADKVRFLNETSKGLATAGGQRLNEGGAVYNSFMEDPRFAALSEADRTSEVTDFLISNRGTRSGMDPRIMDERMRGLMGDSGLFDMASTEAGMKSVNERYSPKLTLEEQKLYGSLIKPAGGNTTFNMPGANGGSYSGGIYRDAMPGRTGAGIPDMVNELAASRDITTKTPDTLPWWLGGDRADIGLLDPAISDLRTAAGRLQSKGITDTGAIRATLDEAFDQTNGNKIKEKYDFRGGDKFDALVAYGLHQQDVQSQQRNNKSGTILPGNSSAAIQQQNEYMASVNDLMSRGDARRLTDDELAASALEFMFGEAPAAAPAGTPAPAPQAGGQIMPAGPDVGPVYGHGDMSTPPMDTTLMPPQQSQSNPDTPIPIDEVMAARDAHPWGSREAAIAAYDKNNGFEDASPQGIMAPPGNQVTEALDSALFTPAATNHVMRAPQPDMLSDVTVDNTDNTAMGVIGDQLKAGGNLLYGLSSETGKSILNIGSSIADGARAVDKKLTDSAVRREKASQTNAKARYDGYADEVINSMKNNGSFGNINRFHLMESLGSDKLSKADKAKIKKYLDNN